MYNIGQIAKMIADKSGDELLHGWNAGQYMKQDLIQYGAE